MNPALDKLLKTQPALWRGCDRYDEGVGIATGFAALDKALPSAGWSIGGVTELLTDQQGIGELSLLLPALQQLTCEGRWVTLINSPYIPYAPAFANAGVRLNRLLIINTDNDTDTLWAAEQVLRTGLFASVVAWVNRSTAQRQRRLQLAAESGKSWAVVYRPASVADEHSPVSTRIRVSLQAGQLLLDIFKSRGGKPLGVTLNPVEFDTSQGVEWPIPKERPGERPGENSAESPTEAAAGNTVIHTRGE